MTEQIEFRKSYAILSALRNNIPEIDKYFVKKQLVNVYNDEVDRLVSLGFTDFHEFRIPETEFKPRKKSFNPRSGTTYTEELFVDRSVFLVKLDSLLTFFELTSREAEIGFST